MSVSAESTGIGGPTPRGGLDATSGGRLIRARPRLLALVAGALPVLAFPRPGLDLLAWVALVPGMLLVQRAATGREAAVRGWWFGAGYLAAALYWLIPNVGPGLALVAAVAGALWAPWGYAVWALV